MDKNYVLNHDYGYGKGQEEINKIKLRNLCDLETYVLDVLKNSVVGADGYRVTLVDTNVVEEVKIFKV